MKIIKVLFLFLSIMILLITLIKYNDFATGVNAEVKSDPKNDSLPADNFEDDIQTTLKDEIQFMGIPDSIGQIILIYNLTRSETVGHLQGFEKVDDIWLCTFNTINVNFGKNGFALYEEKIEGDGKTPTGMFSIGKAFGYEKNISCELDFIELNENHYWVSDTSAQNYNRLVDYKPAAFFEKMYRSDHLYEYGIIIRYNMDNPVKNKGSAIFIHVERRPNAPTAGCVSAEKKQVKELIKWINPKKSPISLMGTKLDLIAYGYIDDF